MNIDMAAKRRKPHKNYIPWEELISIGKTGNILAVQRQLGHTHAAYSIQYARVTDQELAEALYDR